MASNELPRAQNKLWALAADMLDGMVSYEALLGLAQNTSAKLAPELAAAQASQRAYEAAARGEDDAQEARNIANSNVKSALAQTKRLLADVDDALSAIWRGASIEIPATIPDRLVVLARAIDYLHQHPAEEIPAKSFSEAALRATFEALENARAVLKRTVVARVDAKTLRNAADLALRHRLSALVEELGQPGLLTEDDDRWYAFGLVPPGGVERPGMPPDDLVLRQLGPGAVLAAWSATPRAHRYRVFAQVEGRDADFLPLGLEEDLDCTFEGLPATGTLRVRIVATNPAGDSPPSATAELSLG